MKQSTISVHAGTKPSVKVEGINTPIYYSSSYEVDLGASLDLPYPRRCNTPNQIAVSAKIAKLENAKFAFVTGSGMAAISTSLISNLERGDHILIQKEIYGGTYNFIINELEKMGIEYSFFSCQDLTVINSLIKSNSKIIYCETPSNPLLRVVDLEEIVKIAHKFGLLSVIDNTFASPINQNPLDWGFDIVVHSGSKFLSGHSDILCGAIAMNSSSLQKKTLKHLSNWGPVLDAQACYLLERSLKTLALRVERQSQSALAIAEHLLKHPAVKKVNYPGLKYSEDYPIASKQMSGFGAVLSFEIDGDLEASKKFINRLEIIQSALSLGGVESLVSIPRMTSHSMLSAETREEAGIKDSLIRLSVGIEDLEDLIRDLNNALV